ncbi:Chaperone protein ClpC3, chloroplastic [Vitis vinifera]|uniref:Chaperone protein ClpC3, chloroplastic n=1 Tax=Vitis vinifera TaxID=29760 RepID=A0A438JD97_VITVI|nr:Chaperone protein ClpC3, chloroplastic [Vitis vinifera]
MEKLEQKTFKTDMLNKYGTDLTKLAEQKGLHRTLQSPEPHSNSCRRSETVKGSEGEIILFIDEAHTLVGAGSGGQALDAANILKPALAKGELKCIAATTVDEYVKYIEKDPALKRRFQPVDVPEPSVEDAIEILKGLSKKYEAHHHVQYSDNALIAAARFEYYLPDKAIDLIDEAGARVQLHQPRMSTKIPTITEMDIQHIISSRTGIPLEKLSAKELMKLVDMEETPRESIIGQDDAVKAICRALRRDGAGIRDPTRPIASFLFTGPTGVGKTELAKLIALEYFGSKEAMVRIDMSEYMEKHTVSRLCGSPPGYVGHDEGGQLTEAVRRRPYNLVLFDEIEKAHRDVMNVMLQILDDGRLTDGKGRTVDFKNTLIIMTSNIGGSLITQTKIQLGFEQVKNLVAEELKKNFLPEFLNRLDEVIVFKQLSKPQLREIVDIRLEEVYTRFEEAKNINVEVTEELKEKLVEEGFSPGYGARPLRRAIVSLLEDKVADMILEGTIVEGDTVSIGI